MFKTSNRDLRDATRKREWLIPSLLSVGLGTILFTGNALRQYTLHSAVMDLGVYEHIAWRMAFNGEWYLAFRGHCYPVMYLVTAVYRIWPSGICLAFVQSVSLAVGVFILLLLLGKSQIDTRSKLVLGISLLFYAPVWYCGLFDFHPDVFIVPLAAALYGVLLSRTENKPPLDEHRLFRKMVVLILLIIAIDTTKEIFILCFASGMFFAALGTKWWRIGTVIALIHFGLFYIVTFYIIPHFTPWASEWAGARVTTGWLSVPTLLSRIVEPMRWVFLIYTLAPFAGLALLTPRMLTPLIPSVLIVFFSPEEVHHNFASHYTVLFIPCVFLATVQSVIRITSGNSRMRLMWAMLACSILFHVWSSPSPLSRIFWLKPQNQSFSYVAYVPTERDKTIRSLIYDTIPKNPDISAETQNSLYCSILAQRKRISLFPENLDNADYVLLDTKRTPFVRDRINPKDYQEYVAKAVDTREVLVEYDGFIILGERRSGR